MELVWIMEAACRRAHCLRSMAQLRGGDLPSFSRALHSSLLMTDRSG